MQTDFAVCRDDEPVRSAGLKMARSQTDVVPVVNDDGAVIGVVTERALARRYIRESRETSSLVDTPTAVRSIVDVLQGEALVGEDHLVAGRVWVFGREAGTSSGIETGDVVVVGNRDDAQREALELGAALLVLSNRAAPTKHVVELARERGAALVVSPLDSYVTGRMITLAAPCTSVMDAEPLTVRPDDVLGDIEDAVKDIHYAAAVAVDGAGCPVGLVTRATLVSPQRRQVILVDHAELSQSVPGVESAEILEILDHHHIGSIETTVPVTATFDPVGSTSTLVVERFRQNGMEPSRPTAIALLGAVLSDTVILNSPTTTERDHTVVEYLGRVLGLDSIGFGRDMFQSTSDVSQVDAEVIATRDAKEYPVGDSQTICIAQIETVGDGVLERRDELLEELSRLRAAGGHALYALMITDILAKGTKMLVAGDAAPIERVFGRPVVDGAIDLPGVMSRKKQVAPKLLAAL